MPSERRKRAAEKTARRKAELEQEALRAAAADPAVQEARALAPREERTGDYERAVAFPVRVAAGWAWRLAAIAAAVVGVGWVLTYFSGVSVPVAVALLLAALLHPLIAFLTRHGWPRGLAVAVGVFGGFLAVIGALVLIVRQIVNSAGELGEQAAAGVQQVIDWVEQGPLPIDPSQFEQYQDQALSWLQGQAGVIGGYAASAGGATLNFLTGLAIALFTLFFFLYDGKRIWNAVLRFVPSRARERADVAARSGWQALSSYVRATVLVAGVDAVGVLIVALALQVPLAPALAALVFLGAFVPIVGALVTGFVAVAVALVAVGPLQALLMLGGIIFVMQLEGNVLQPFLLGKAVSVHPLAVILAITVGITLGGIVGGLIAIPVLAFTQKFVSTLSRGDDFGRLHLPDPSGGEPVQP